ncbi:hypothetical protein PINS_up001426 [Pythium insidiosum]|nr:hypothetical protein PINS_up001426 [Pythium insidiosum]
MEELNEDALRQLMGFTSFGRRHKRAKRSRDSIVGSSPPQSKTTNGDNCEPREPLVHVHVGTTVDSKDFAAHRVLHLENADVIFLKASGEGAAQHDLPSHSSEEDQDSAARLALPASSQELLMKLQATKCRFEELPREVFSRARQLANPYESLGRGRFLNRSAMKMANLDFIFGWTRRMRELRTENEPFVFADLCGAPGGFSEYLLWRHEQQEQDSNKLLAEGFGISIRGEDACTWELAAPDSDRVKFHVLYGADGTGDLCEPQNIDSFADTMRRRYPSGAHLVVADGGFRDARNQVQQEALMTSLIAAETLAMFKVLRVGGSFACKTFEISTPAMLSIMWILLQSFERVTIVKPLTSRPASSERYVVADRLLPHAPLSVACEVLLSLTTSSDPTIGALPQDSFFDAITKDHDFMAFIAKSSDRLAAAQIEACVGILECAANAKKRRSIGRSALEAYRAAWGV